MSVAELIERLQIMPPNAEVTHVVADIVVELHDVKLYGADDDTTMFVCID